MSGTTLVNQVYANVAPLHLAKTSASDPHAVPDSSHLSYYARYFGDPISRLFWHGPDLWLGILPRFGRRFADLLDSHVLDDLFAHRLLLGLEPVTEPANGFETVYRLDPIPRITYWHEWSPRMGRAATLRLIELVTELAQRKLTLRNPHPWNLLFDGRQFCYVNPGSIVPLDPTTFARSYEKIARFFVRPLLLINHGFEHVARRLTEDVREGVLSEDVKHLGCEWACWEGDADREAVLPFLAHLREELATLQCTSNGNRWIDYFATDCDFRPGTSWTRKMEVLESLVQNPSIQTVLDLGSNTGHYTSVAAGYGREVVATDFDPSLVDVIFEKTQKTRMSVYPAILDFTDPSPGHGITNLWLPPATERFKSDLVLCFALVHHMVFGRYRLDFEQIARGVHSFARKWALVEYVGRERVHPGEWRPDADGWYSAEQLAAAFARHFPSVEVLPPARDGRRVLVCGPDRRLA